MAKRLVQFVNAVRFCGGLRPAGSVLIVTEKQFELLSEAPRVELLNVTDTFTGEPDADVTGIKAPVAELANVNVSAFEKMENRAVEAEKRVNELGQTNKLLLEQQEATEAAYDEMVVALSDAPSREELDMVVLLLRENTKTGSKKYDEYLASRAAKTNGAAQ